MLTWDEKKRLVEQRLRQYAVQRFNLELDLAAYEAAGHTEAAEHARAEMAKLELASAAVSKMLPDEE